MKNKISIITKYIILFLTVVPLISFFVLPVRQKMIQHQMKEALEKKLLQKIIISEKNVYWIKPGKEIWIENKMFDIKALEYKNGVYTFSGLFDEEETAVVKQIQQTLPLQSSSTNKILFQLFQLFQSIQKKFLSDLLILEPARTTLHPDNRLILLTKFISVPTPPPKV